jgi:predicted RNase H-like HicB family nuclease
MKLTYTVLVYEAGSDESGYWARVAELPGCYTQGETIAEIRENVKDAIEEYLHALSVTGQPPPPRASEKFEIAV